MNADEVIDIQDVPIIATDPRQIFVYEDIAIFDFWENRKRYWVGGTSSWNASADIKWSTTSGGVGGAGIPTASDDVFFDANSGAVTVSVTSAGVCKNLDFTGFTGTLSGSSGINISGSLTLVATMTVTGYSGKIIFDATTPGQTITTNGILLYNSIDFNGAGGSWTLQDDFSLGGSSFGSIYLYAGTLDTNGKTVTAPYIFGVSGTGAKTLTLGASTIRTYNWIFSTTTGLTFNANTSTIYWLGVGTASFSGGGLTYYNVHLFIPTAHNCQMTGNNTFNNLTFTNPNALTSTMSVSGTQTVNGIFTATGFSLTSRILVKGTTVGTASTISAATVSISNVDFMDITGTGAGSWTGTSIGNALGNSGITFTTPVTRYCVIGAGSGYWTSTSTWSGSSGGAPGASVPLCHDTVYFNGSSGVGLVYIDIPRLGTIIDCSGFTGTLSSITVTGGFHIFDSLILSAGHTFTPGTNLFSFWGRGSHTLTSGGKSFYQLAFRSIGGTYTFQDDVVATDYMQLFYGTIDANDKNITIKQFIASSTGTRGITMGTGTWTLTGSGMSTSSPWYVGTGLTVTCETSTIEFTDATASTKDFVGGNKTYYILKFSGAGTGTYQIYNNNTFTTITSTKTNAFSLVFNTGSTQTVSNFTVSGTPGNLVQITSTATGAHFLTKSGTGNVICDYLNIAHSVASSLGKWFARNSTDNQASVTAGSGWIFGEPSFLTSDTVSVTESVSLIRGGVVEVIGSETITITESVSFRVFTPDAVETNETIYVYDLPWIWIMDPGGNNRYWIGGAGSWNDSSHWAFSSGGTGGAPIPTPYDDVFIDSNSGLGSGGTITLNGAYWSCRCHDFTANTGYTTADKYRIDYVTSDLSIYGSATFERSLYFQSGTWVYFVSNETSNTITSNGCWFSDIYFGYDDAGPWPLPLVDTTTYELHGDFYVSQTFYIERGIINFNDSRFQIYSYFNFAADLYDATFTGYGQYRLSLAPTLNLQSSLISLDGNGYGHEINEWDSTGEATVTINPGTSTIRFNNIDGNWDSFYFQSSYEPSGYGAKTFNRVEVLSNQRLELWGHHTYNELILYPQHAAGSYFKTPSDSSLAGSLTVGSLAVEGAVNDQVYIYGSTDGQSATITKTSGDVGIDYANIKDITGAGPVEWFVGDRSTNVSNNNNLYFYNKTIGIPDRTVKTAIDLYRKTTWGQYNMYSGNNVEVGQSFFNLLGTTLDSIELYVGAQNFPTGNLQVRVYTHGGVYGTSGVPTGAALASSELLNIDSDLFLTRYLTQRVRFTFTGANRIMLGQNTSYVFLLQYSGGDSSNYIYIACDTTSPAHSGNAFYSHDGVSYTAQNSRDLSFVVYGSSELSDPIYESLALTEGIPITASDLTNYISIYENITVSENTSFLITPLLISESDSISVSDITYQYVFVPGTLFTTYNFDIGSQYYISFDYELSSGHVMLYQGTQLIFDSGAWFVRGVYQNVYIRENVSITIT